MKCFSVIVTVREVSADTRQAHVCDCDVCTSGRDFAEEFRVKMFLIIEKRSAVVF